MDGEIINEEVITSEERTKPFSPLISPNDFTQYKHLCFIDEAVPSFSDYLNSETYPVVYNSSTDRESLKSFLLAQFTHIDRIAFVFHGPPNNSPPFTSAWFINNETYFSLDNQSFLIDLCTSLTVQNMDFLPCNLLQQQEWKDYFAVFTNVLVGASSDDTGNLRYGGDWIMENTMQNVQDLYFSAELENWTGLLFTQVGPVGSNVAQLEAMGYTPAVLNAAGYVTPEMTVIATIGNATNFAYDFSISGDLMYVAVGVSIKVLNLTTTTSSILYTGSVTIFGLVVAGGFIYITTGAQNATGNYTVGKLNLNGTVVNSSFITRIWSKEGLISDGTWLYTTYPGTNSGVYRISLSSGGDVDTAPNGKILLAAQGQFMIL